ncbi:MAG TPA: GDP-mannose 4,6-dehydratase, partial [Gemmatimonadaceae bacterium]|nr:GDP-mannose 4,6-dehydratase [Gemmatimonadaceae bacterium]
VRSAKAGRLVRDGGFDVVAHLAAQVDVRKSVNDPAEDADINIAGALRLLEGIRAIKGKRPRLVFSSTGGALYGAAERFPTAEDAPTDPDSPYGVAKLAVEQYLGYYARIWGIESAVARFGNVYGPRQNPHGDAGVIAIFSGRIMEGSELTVFGTGAQTRDYIFVADVAEALFTLATRPLPKGTSVAGRALNIGTGVETSVLDLVRELGRVTGAAPKVKHAPERPGELSRSLLDPGKASRLYGWRAKTSLAEGLGVTYEWVKRQAEEAAAPAGAAGTAP